MTRTRLQRIEQLYDLTEAMRRVQALDAARPPLRGLPDLDATAAALARTITEDDCGCWIVTGADGVLRVPCDIHETPEWWLE